MIKINGYVARDEDSHLYVYLKDKPTFDKNNNMWHSPVNGDYMEIDKNEFPKLKYTDEPIEVTLEIKLARKKKDS